jgi:4-diphosphocytidyl-2-C-methyl-D-erythritol kinase
MYPVSLCDALEITTSSETRMSLSGFPITGPIEDNLVYRAYCLLKKRFQLPLVRIHLHKAVPAQSGLGGGSSDAAFMLNMLNDLFELKLVKEELQDLSLEMGSDCPFFITNRPANSSGRGEILEETDLNINDYFICIVKPDVYISTSEAYRNIPINPCTRKIADITKMPVEKWKNYLTNDFEDFAFKRYPVIKDIKESLYKEGAIYASMSGSGSAVYGIFSSNPGLKSNYKDMFYYEGIL